MSPGPPSDGDRTPLALPHLFLLKELVKRDFQGRYVGSLLGFVWSFFLPLSLLVLYYFVFSTVLQLSLLGARTGNFAFYMFAGLVPWMAIQEGALRGATAITDNAALVRKLTFPSEVLVLAVVLAALMHSAIAGGLFVLVVAARGQLAAGGLPILLLLLPFQVALTFGLGLLLAALNVFFRDVSQVVGMAMNAWFFLTPIVYSLSQVPEPYRTWIGLNPLTGLVDIYRYAFFGGEPAWGSLGTLALLSSLVLVCGLLVFRRLRPAFADTV